ncbi:hypothetical protein GCM10028796_46920 [Ramlibacter monticola]|uniref:Uncharacterized protein n=1 Tax=Ramlibacter monticola TaxID=1926872 RepID=A0A936Z4Q3_9BURK|nr:hypothetical protein [Ramlibacter monticola]MBL0394317.1 hypothetical protein [Ramlibacter monticola]
MKQTIERVTPRIAREWMKLNVGNRPLRVGHVEMFHAMFGRGEFVTSIQGIAFDEDGNLMDGQHRLTAISLLPDGWEGRIVVWRDVSRDTVFPVLDTVSSPRSIADVLRIGRDLSEVGSFLGMLLANGRTGRTPQFVDPIVAWLMPEFNELMEFCPTRKRTWSSAPVRAAAILAMKTSRDRDYIKLVYQALVRRDFSSMSPVVKALANAEIDGRIGSKSTPDLFARCVKVFDPRNANLKKVQVADAAPVLEWARSVVERGLVPPPPPPAKKVRVAARDGALRAVAGA